MQFSLGTWIQISEVVPLLSEPFAVTATPVPDQPEISYILYAETVTGRIIDQAHADRQIIIAGVRHFHQTTCINRTFYHTLSGGVGCLTAGVFDLSCHRMGITPVNGTGIHTSRLRVDGSYRKSQSCRHEEYCRSKTGQ